MYLKLSLISLALLCFILFFFTSFYQFKDTISSVCFHRKAHEVWVVTAYLKNNKQQSPQHITCSLNFTVRICSVRRVSNIAEGTYINLGEEVLKSHFFRLPRNLHYASFLSLSQEICL